MDHRPKTPIFPAWVHERTKSGVWIIHVRCGYCDRVHQHGGGSDDAPAMDGHRCAHCVFDEPMNLPGYVLADETSDVDWDAEARHARTLVHDFRDARKQREEEEHQRVLDRIGQVDRAFARSAERVSSPRTKLTPRQKREQDDDFLSEMRKLRNAERGNGGPR